MDYNRWAHIRFATEADIPRLLVLEQMFDNALTEEALARELTVGMGLVMDCGGSVLGYALVRRDRDLLDLTRLAVDHAAHSHGMGTRLLLKVLELGHTTVLTVMKDNPRALKLYLRHGFEIVGHISDAASASRHAWVLRRAAAASDYPA